MQPLKGITVVTLEHAIAAPFATRQLADLGARVIKIERPGSGDFARGYDERVRGLASHFVWTNRSKESLTLDVKHPEAARGARAPGHGKGRRRGAEPGAGRGIAPGPGLRQALRRQAGLDRLRHLRLRRRPAQSRPVPRQEGLRPPDPERGRLRLGHRHAGRALQGGPLDRGHRRRHVRVQQHPRGAAAARPDRQGPTHRHLDAGVAGRVDQLPALLRLRRRRAAAAHRREPRDHLPLWPVPGRRRHHRDAGPAERARMGELLRQGAAAARTRQGPALHRQLQARGGAHGAAPDHRGGLRNR